MRAVGQGPELALTFTSERNAVVPHTIAIVTGSLGATTYRPIHFEATSEALY
jgi:hypothetical protein